MSLPAAFSRAAHWLADVAFPPRCLGCGGGLGRTAPDGVPACGACREGLLEPATHLCLRCGARVPPGGGARRGCAACRRFDPRVPRALACGPYAGRLGALVRSLKFSARPAVARLLG
jgi:predicted amidophosphoribosyltransferase